jgi:hypothetical protein
MPMNKQAALLRKLFISLMRRKLGKVEQLAKFIEAGKGQSIDFLNLCLDLGLSQRVDFFMASKTAEHNILHVIRALLLKGETDKALSVVSHLDLNTNKSFIADIVGLIAPLSPRQALSLCATSQTLPSCAPAIALRLGDLSGFKSLTNILRSRLGADQWLLASNYENNQGVKLDCVNKYFQEHGLSAIYRIDEADPLYVNNIACDSSSLKNYEGPLLSVVLTSFNCDKYIDSSIKSVLTQTYHNLELIVVDDGSKDQTYKRAESIARNDPRIKLYRLDQNVGTYAAKNFGLTVAKGEFVAFQDADDWSHPERFQRCIQVLRSNKQLIATSALYVRINSEGFFVSSKVWPMTRWTPNSVVFRRCEVVNKIGFFDNVRTGADSEFVARMRVTFGEKRYFKLRIPLILASHRSGSLMTSPDTGLKDCGYSETRARYQEAWTERLIENILKREPLFQPHLTCSISEPGNEAVVTPFPA